MIIYGSQKDNYGIIECENASNPMEASLQHVLESEINWNNLMRAVAIKELSVLESTGIQMVYEAADTKGFLNKVKEFFRNIIAKIKGLFQSFVAHLDKWFKNDEAFIKKYQEAKIDEKDLTGLTINGYKFTTTRIDTDGSAAERIIDSKLGGVNPKESELDNYIANFKDKEKIYAEIRGALVRANKELTSKEFSTELKKLARDGKEEKEKIAVNKEVIKNAFISIKTKDIFVKLIENTKKGSIKAIEDLISNVDKIKPDLKDIYGDSSSKAETSLSNLVAAYKEVSSMVQIMAGAQLAAIKDEVSQAKSICVAAYTYKAKNGDKKVESKNESTFLSDITFI